MRLLSALASALDWAGRVVVGLCLIGLLGIVTLQVIDRHFVDVPIAAPDSYARILLIWLTFVGFALAVRAGLAIRVDLMDHWLPPRARAGLALVFDLVKLAVLALLAVKGWLLVEIGFYQSILGTDLTTAVPNAGLWVATVMMIVFVSLALLEILTGKRVDPHDEAKAEGRAG